MPKILLVEDDPEVTDVLKTWLERELISVDCLADGNEFLDRIRLFSYDLLVLDWNLPGKLGIDLCRSYRAQGGLLSIIMLTGRAGLEDITLALDSGADDYLTKPFHPRELVARSRALLRRPRQDAPAQIDLAGLCLDSRKKTLRHNELEVELRPKEYAIIDFLARHPDHYFAADSIYNRVWSSESGSSPDTIRSHITRLRRKMANLGCADRMVTAHGFGYKLTSR